MGAACGTTRRSREGNKKQNKVHAAVISDEKVSKFYRIDPNPIGCKILNNSVNELTS